MHPLIPGPQDRQAIEHLIRRAGREAVGYATMVAMSQGRITADGTRNRHLTISLTNGYAATYTHEEHRPETMCRHLSVSVPGEGRAVSAAAVERLMETFGFVNRLQVLLRTGTVWSEASATGTAIHIVEPLTGDVTDLRQ